MTRAQILLEEKQQRFLFHLAKIQKKSMSEIVRELIQEKWLQSLKGRKKDPLFKLDGMGHDRARDVSVRHDEYLYGRRAKRNWEK